MLETDSGCVMASLVEMGSNATGQRPAVLQEGEQVVSAGNIITYGSQDQHFDTLNVASNRTEIGHSQPDSPLDGVAEY